MGCGASSATAERAQAYEAMQRASRGGGGGGTFPGAAAGRSYAVGTNQYAVSASGYPGGYPGGGYPGAQHGLVVQGYPGAVAAVQRGGPTFSAGSGRGGAPGGSAAPARKAAPRVGQKTLKVKNNFMLHKDSMKLESVEEGAKQELHFTFDAEIAGEAQIFWDCVDMTIPEVLSDPMQLQQLGLDLQREKAGTSQSWSGAAIRSAKATSKSMQSERTWSHAGKSGTVVPLVVRLRGIVEGEGEQSQTTYAVLHASGEAAAGKERIAPRCVRQKVLCQGRIYETQEVYGAAQGSEDDPCVVCQTEPRECIILPCRHCCLCFECAKDLTQTGSVQVEFGQVVTGADPKYARKTEKAAHCILCPMCREDIESVVRKGVGGSGDGGSTRTRSGKKHAKASKHGGGGKAVTTGPSSDGSASDLPYGGNMQKAMQAQDRDAIRKIMAARQGGGTAEGSDRSSGGRAAAPPPKADLPYGGDMQAAMKAQDRDAIRKIMAARDAPSKQ